MDVARPTGSDCIKDSRGVAIADFNGDGKLDLIINNNNATPTVYLNNVQNSGNSVVLKLVGTRSNRDAIGAQVRLTAGGKTMMRQVEAGSGYASEVMFPVHFGLGSATRIEAVEIVWPSGARQKFRAAETAGWVNKSVRLEENVERAVEVIAEEPAPTQHRGERSGARARRDVSGRMAAPPADDWRLAAAGKAPAVELTIKTEHKSSRLRRKGAKISLPRPEHANLCTLCAQREAVNFRSA